jgi:hypothetical protein
MRRRGFVVAGLAVARRAGAGEAAGQNVSFGALWDGYKVGNPYPDPGGGFGDNQCAIRLSVALWRARADLRSFGGAAVTVGGRRVAIRADELAAWLNAARPAVGLS